MLPNGETEGEWMDLKGLENGCNFRQCIRNLQRELSEVSADPLRLQNFAAITVRLKLQAVTRSHRLKPITTKMFVSAYPT
jgi:hypothetical protein